MIFLRTLRTKQRIATVLLFAVLLPVLVGGGVFGVARGVGAAENPEITTELEKLRGDYQAALEAYNDSVLFRWPLAPSAETTNALHAIAIALNDKESEFERLGGQATYVDVVPNASPCGTTDIVCGIEWIILQVINAILAVFRGVLILVLSLVMWAGSYTTFINSPIVTIGWGLVRDIANLFFILILLVIAFATILGVEKLSYKQHLMKLLIMAVVINFSKMITGLMIDFSQVILMTFSNSLSGTGNLIKNLGFADIGAVRPGAASSVAANFFALLLDTVLGIIFTVFAVVVIGIIFIMLLARIIMLWILAILSPLPFLLSAFPQGQQYAGKWWGELSKNLVGGPVLMFFLWLALRVQQDVRLAFQNVGISAKVGASQMGTGSAMVSFAVSMGLLIAGLKFAQESGAAGAGVAGAALDKAKKFGTELRQGAYRETIGRAVTASREGGFLKKHPGFDVPTRWKAKKEFREGEAKIAQEGALAHAKQRVIEKATGGRVKTPLAEAHEAKMEREYRENFKGRNKDDLAAQGNALLGLRVVKDKKTGEITYVKDKEVRGHREKRARRALASSQGEEGFVDDQMAAIAKDQKGDSKEVTAYRKQFRETYLKDGYNQQSANKFLQDSIGSKDSFEENMARRASIEQEEEKKAKKEVEESNSKLSENERMPPKQVEREIKKRAKENAEKKYADGFKSDSDGQRTIYDINEMAKKNTHAQLLGGSGTDVTGERIAKFGGDSEKTAIIEAGKFKNSRDTAGQAPHAYGSIDLETGRYRKDAGEFGEAMQAYGFKGKDQAFIGQWQQPRVANMMMGGTADESTWDKDSGTMDLTKGGAAGMLKDSANIEENILGAAWVKAGGTKGEGQGASADKNTNQLMRFKVMVDKENNIVTDDDIAEKLNIEVSEVTDKNREEYGPPRIVGIEGIKAGKFIEPPPLTKSQESKEKQPTAEKESKISPTSEPPPTPGTTPPTPPTSGEGPTPPTSPPAPEAPPIAPQHPTAAPPPAPAIPPEALTNLTKEIQKLGTTLSSIDLTKGMQTVIGQFGNQLQGMNTLHRQAMGNLAKAIKERVESTHQRDEKKKNKRKRSE